MRLSEEELADIMKNNPDIKIHKEQNNMPAGEQTPHLVAASAKKFAGNKKTAGERPSKYRAIRTELNGVTYDSKAEAQFAQNLTILAQAGKVKYWLRQVPFYLPANVRYLVDFQIFYEDGTVEYVDVKGMDTPVSKLKRKQVEAIYPVKIQIARRSKI